MAVFGQQEVGICICGLLRTMDGTTSRQAEKVSAFAEDLHSRVVVPLEFRDERLTTVAAQRLMKAASPKKTRKTRKKARGPPRVARDGDGYGRGTSPISAGFTRPGFPSRCGPEISRSLKSSGKTCEWWSSGGCLKKRFYSP